MKTLQELQLAELVNVRATPEKRPVLQAHGVMTHVILLQGQQLKDLLMILHALTAMTTIVTAIPILPRIQIVKATA